MREQKKKRKKHRRDRLLQRRRRRRRAIRTSPFALPLSPLSLPISSPCSLEPAASASCRLLLPARTRGGTPRGRRALRQERGRQAWRLRVEFSFPSAPFGPLFSRRRNESSLSLESEKAETTLHAERARSDGERTEAKGERDTHSFAQSREESENFFTCFSQKTRRERKRVFFLFSFFTSSSTPTPRRPPSPPCPSSPAAPPSPPWEPRTAGPSRTS